MRPAKLKDIHPSLWRGTQLARSFGRVVDTGYAAMSAELPGGGWPVSKNQRSWAPNTGRYSRTIAWTYE